jgi:hypothetical protein
MSEVKTVDIKGLLDTYEFPYTLVGSGQELLIRPITTGQMKKVLAYEDETNPYVVEEALDKLIASCVVNQDFNIDDVYLQDRFSLLLEIRKVTKGDSYQFNYKCKKCGVDNMVTLLLSELPVKPFIREDNVLTINDKLQFEVDFPTRADQKDAVLRVKGRNLPHRENVVEVQTGTFANAIKKVHTPEGVLEDVSFEDKVYILDNISGEVFENFTNWFKDHDFGVEFEKEVTCMSCANKENADIPLSDFFV